MSRHSNSQTSLELSRFLRRFCPDLILEGHLNGYRSGEFVGSTVAVDITGFTRLTETFTQDGDRGAEMLARIINALFAPLVKCVYRHGGFVSHFAGDGFVAIFPEAVAPQEHHLDHAIAAAWKMRRAFDRRSKFETPIGSFQIGIRFGVSCGPIEWRILSANDVARKSFHFRGNALSRCTQAQALAKGRELAFAPDTAVETSFLKKHITRTLIDDVLLLENPPEETKPDIHQAALPHLDEVAAEFLPHSTLHPKLKGEFRNVVSIFIGVSAERVEDKVEDIFETILQTQAKYEGFLKDICFDEKGCYLVFFWGAPLALERDSDLALGFLTDLFDLAGTGIKAGITLGTAHAGLIGSSHRQEFSCHGSKVNLAARLMVAAPWGEVWCDQLIMESASSQFEFEPLGLKEFKGFSDHLPVSKLTGRNLEYEHQENPVGFYDREEPLARLTEVAEQIFSGKFAGVIVVCGEPGIGKTTLVRSLHADWCDRIEDGRAAWITCSADEVWSQPLAPFRRCLESYFDIPPGSKEDERRTYLDWGLSAFLSQVQNNDLREEIKRTESFLAAVLGVFTPGTLYEQVGQTLRQENTFLALKSFFLAEVEKTPVVVEIEDLQWFDQDSLDFLSYLANDCHGLPIVMIATCRIGETEGYQNLALRPEVPFTSIELGNLSPQGVREFAQVLFEGDVSDSLHSFLVEKSNGNPLYVEQLAWALKEQELVQKTRHGTLHQFELIGTAKDQVPASVALIVMSRLDRLPTLVKQTVQMGAVLGQVIQIGLLGRMIRNQKRAERDAKHAVAQLIWVAESMQRYRFKHALLRDSAYTMQLPSRRMKLHRLAALAFEVLYSPETPDYYGTLAYHFEAGGLTSRAVMYLDLAAKDARRKCQVLAAIAYLKRLLKQPLEQSKRIDAIEILAEQLNIAGQWEKSEETVLEVLPLIGDAFSSRRDIRLLLHLGDAYRMRNLHDESRRYIDEAIAYCEKTGDQVLLAKAYSIKAGSHKYAGEFSDSLHYYEMAKNISKKESDSLIHAESLAGLGSLYGLLGLFAKARALDLEALELYEQLDQKSDMTIPLVNVAMECYYMGDHREAVAFFQRAFELAELIGDRVSLWLANHFLGCVRLASNDPESACENFQKALRIRAQFTSDGIPYHIRPHLAEAFLLMGEFAQAAQAILDHFDDVERAKGDRSYGYAQLVVARLLLSQNNRHPNKARKTERKLDKNELRKLNHALRGIGIRTGLPPDPERFFRYALQQAIAGESLALLELVRTLRHFSSFLIEQEPSSQQGRVYLRAARDIARDREMKAEAGFCEALATDLEIDLEREESFDTIDDLRAHLSSEA